MPIVTALPRDYEFPADKVALVIIDMQRDFIEPGGFGEALGNDVRPLGKIVPALKTLLGAFRRLNLPVIHTCEGHCADLSDCPPAKLNRGRGTLKIGDVGPMGRVLVLGEPGNDFVSELKPLPNEIVINKPGKGAFYATELDHILRQKGITHLLITGVTTEVCVQTTMREANDRGYDCLMVEDCTESYFPEFKRATLDMVRAQGGIVGWTASSDAVIKSLENVSPKAAAEKAPVGPYKLMHEIVNDPKRLAALPWVPFRPGLSIVRIYDEGSAGSSAALLRYQPGASLAEHRHAGFEHIYIVSGSQADESGEFNAGDFFVNAPGTKHSVRSENGCVALAVWERSVKFQ